MRGGYTHEYHCLADRYPPYAMNDGHRIERPARHRVGHDLLQASFGHTRIMVEFEAGRPVVTAHLPDERRDAACAPRQELLHRRGDVYLAF